MKKQPSLIRKRGYSDVDQNNFRALELNAEASLHKELDRKIKELRQNTSKDKQATKRANKLPRPREITGEIEFKEITGRRNRKKPIKKSAAVAKGVDSSSSGSGSHADLDLGVFKGFEYSA